MIIIDSGIGGLAVVRALRRLAPGLAVAYLADTAAFPYGSRPADEIAARATKLVTALAPRVPLSTVVLACNTLSTLALADLRQRFPSYEFVGTVPAIKVAAAESRSRRFTLLATPNTARSSYSQQLIAEFAADCTVDCYGAPELARYAEYALLGEPVDDTAWRQELAPAFHDDAQGRTDTIVLGCTHYPLVQAQLAQAAPWPVRWVDSSEAIARRALALPHVPMEPFAYVTGAPEVDRYAALFAREGFAATQWLDVDSAPRAA